MILPVGTFLLLLLALAGGDPPPTSGVLFSCSFQRDTCGMLNQPGLEARWTRTLLKLGGRTGFAMSVTGNEAGDHFARFMTPYLETGGEVRRGCLRFRYFIDGLSPASIACIKQGAVTQYVFATARKTQDHWAQARVDVEFLGDSTMFYFEADTRVQEFGNSIVAFTDVSITDGTCTPHHTPRRRQ